MKKLICILSAALTLCSLTACKKAATSTDTETTAVETTVDGNIAYYTDEDGNTVSEIFSTTRFDGTTNPLSEITLTIARSRIPDLASDYNNDLSLYCTKNGFTSFTTDSEGNVTFVMTASVYHTLTAEKRALIFNKLSPLIESDTYPYFKGYIPDDDYSQVTLKVDKSGYTEADSTLFAQYVGDLFLNYQIFLTDSQKICTVNVVDAETDELLSSVTRTLS